MDYVSAFCVALVNALAQGAPYVVIGYLAAAVIKEFVPVRVLTQEFGSSRIWPLLKAVVVGTLLPICSCGVVPLGIGAFKCGAARGTTLAFMTSAPTISPVAILLSFSLLGPKFTIVFVIVALTGSLLVGLIGNRLFNGKEEEVLRARNRVPAENEQLKDSANRTLGAKLKGAVKWAFWDLGSDVSVDLLIGLSIAAAILVFLPLQWISSLLGNQNLGTLILVILIGIPVYTCSVPSIPVVRSLLLMGMSPGAGVAYLLAGPATNLGELSAIRGSMGARTALLFAGGLFSMAIIGGLATDHLVYAGNHGGLAKGCCVPALFDEGVRNQTWGEMFAHIPLWHVPFMIAMAATILLGLGRRAYGVYARSCDLQDAAMLADGISLMEQA